MECVSLKTNMLGSDHLLQQRKLNKLRSKEWDAPSIAHNIWSDKNIAWRWTNSWFLIEKGMHGGIPKLRRLSLLEYFLGCMGTSPRLSAWHSCIFFHHLPSHTWKLPSYETHHKMIRVVSDHNKIIYSLLEINIFVKIYYFSKFPKCFF